MSNRKNRTKSHGWRVRLTQSRDLREAKRRLKHFRARCKDLQEENAGLRERVAQLELQNNTLEQSEFWRVTKPFRGTLDVFKRLFRRLDPNGLFRRGVTSLKNDGFRATLRKLLNRKRARKRLLAAYDPQELTRQRKFVFDRQLKFSILVPLYNTPVVFLREMIRSVQAQTYADWELCLADGSDAEHGDVEGVVRTFCKRDERIVYRKLEKNLGISENTNACIEMATGDYFALLDHDDRLHPSALFEVMRAICEQDADFIYTDEITFSKKISDAYCPHYKPDFSPDLLRSYNYICHLSVFNKDNGNFYSFLSSVVLSIMNLGICLTSE